MKKIIKIPWLDNKNNQNTLILFGILFCISFYIFYKRFPDSFLAANFYAEDGNVFALNIVNEGFLGSLLTTFNGYFIWGIYILTKIGFVINTVLYNGEFAYLPKAFALSSYAFLALCASLPVLLFRRLVTPIYLILFALMASFIPIPGYDYAIIGTIGNLKFLFVYLAFLFIVYRHLLPSSSNKVFFVDLLILICAYTSATVYLLVPILAIPYALDLFKEVKRKTKLKVALTNIFKNKSFISYLVLCILLIPQLIVVAIAGIPQTPGYLDAPLDLNKLIEVLVDRSYNYSVLFAANKSMNDVWVIVIFAALLSIFWFFGNKKHRWIYLFGIFTIACSTVLLLFTRTGITDLFFHYKSSGVDQFFYAQNLVFYFIIIVLLQDVGTRFLGKNARGYIPGVVVAIVVISLQINSLNDQLPKTFMKDGVGDAINNAKLACATDPDDTITIPVYPQLSVKKIDVQREVICTKSIVGQQ